MKRGGGRRYYRPDDLDLLRGIRHLLYGEGYTIRGVQRLLREHGVRFVQNVWQPGAPQPARQPAEEDDTVEETEAAKGAGALRLPLLRGATGGGRPPSSEHARAAAAHPIVPAAGGLAREEIGRASCRERA